MNIQTIGPRNFMATRNAGFTPASASSHGRSDGYAGSIESFDVNQLYLEPSAPSRAPRGGITAQVVGGLLASASLASLAYGALGA